MEIIEMMKKLNEDTKHFYEVTLPEKMKLKQKDNITLSQWFEAQRIIKESCIYERNIAFLETARAKGYNIKINMQSFELSYHGMIE